MLSRIILAVTLICAMLHLISGLMSVCIGVAASVQADIWLAHSVSPIWSGAFFILTGALGVACIKRHTAYLCITTANPARVLYAIEDRAINLQPVERLCNQHSIMCFAAFSVVSLVTAVVSIQLLRLGLVNQTSDGQTFQKEEKDVLILIALATTGAECLWCLMSSFVSCRLAKAAKDELQRKNDGTFHIKVMGEKDIMVITRDADGQKEKREKIFATSL